MLLDNDAMDKIDEPPLANKKHESMISIPFQSNQFSSTND